ncbi:MAG: NAD-dependent epimerase/dehydratase family protein, partial [Acidobacteriota bacterium]
MKILVTGAGGFLGGALAEKLISRGEDVRSFSRRKYSRLAELGVEQHQGDLGDSSSVAEACRGCDLVFHVAAKAGIWGSAEDFHRANVVGTENILEACRRLEIAKLVYTSSPSVIFNGSDMEGVGESVPYPA